MKIPMPSVSLETLLRHALPEGAFLICGHLQQRISGARTFTASTTSSAVEGDLILISAIQLQPDARGEFARIISQLLPSNIHSLAVQGELPIGALAAAIRHNLTVVYLPDEPSLETVERDIIHFLLEKQSELRNHDNTLQQDLVRQANSNFPLQTTVGLLARTLGLPVVLHDTNHLRLAYALPDVPPQWRYHMALLKEQDMAQHFATNTLVNQFNTTFFDSPVALSAAVAADAAVVAYLSVLKCGNQLDDFAPLALARTAAVCSLLLTSVANIYIEKASRTDWLSSWLDAPPSEDLLLSARAEQGEFDPTQVYSIATLRWTPGLDARRVTKPIRPEQLFEQIKLEMRQRRMSGIIGRYRDRTIILLPLERAQHTGRMKHYTIDIAARMTEAFGGLVVAGVGRPAIGLTDLRQSFWEADRAMHLAEQLWNTPRPNFFGDLSLTELLVKMEDEAQLRRFCTDWLSSIVDYDQHNNSDLLLTMSVYFSNNGNMAATAKELNVHRNTLVYRLNRVAEITQLDMDDADVQLNLHLAIKAYRLLQKLDLT